MPWFKVDDTLFMHPKVMRAGNAAMGLWVRAGSWSSSLLTDGYVPDSMIATLGGKRADAERLVRAGLWDHADNGYQFHQWNEDGRQPTRERVEADRAAWRERQRKARTRKSGSSKGASLRAVTE